jgi:transposase
VTIAPDSLPDDIAALKRIIADMARDATTAQAEIAKLKFQLARYRRAEFGRSSEKLAREVEQLELAIETLEADQAERQAAASPAVAAAIEEAVDRQKPARRPLPEHLPREEVRHPAACTCPHCGGALRRIGEEVTETLDYVPGRFKVIRHVREKLSCRACDTVVAAPAPDHVIARGRAGAGLLAHIAISKYDDHLPLYRQAEIFAREGVELETSTLSGWVGATAAALNPLVDALAAEVMASDTLHVDDTPVPVLAPGTGKTKTGRLWTYVRDERPFAGKRPPAALFFYSADRKGAHPQRHLKDFRGVIHADGYAGFNELFAGNRIAEAACWAHVRRKFFDVHAATGSPIAKEALDRIGDLYKVEKTITGLPPERRLQERQKRSQPIAEALAAWAAETLPKLSRKSELAKAFRYMRSRCKGLLRCFADGRLALDNNAAERALRGVAMRRSLYPSCSSLWKHWKLVFGRDATRATCSPNRGRHPLVLQIVGSDLVRRARYDLLGGQDAILDQPANAVMRDAERRSGLGHGDPLAVLLGGTVSMNAVHPAHRADTVCGPGLSLTRRHPHSVQRCGDIRVRPAGRHAAHHRERLVGRAAPVLAGLRLADAQL